MRKIKALGIAPYKGLAIQLKNEALKRDDIDIDVFTGDLEEGVGIARRRFNEEYDIIYSSGVFHHILPGMRKELMENYIETEDEVNIETLMNLKAEQ